MTLSASTEVFEYGARLLIVARNEERCADNGRALQMKAGAQKPLKEQSGDLGPNKEQYPAHNGHMLRKKKDMKIGNNTHPRKRWVTKHI